MRVVIVAHMRWPKGIAETIRRLGAITIQRREFGKMNEMKRLEDWKVQFVSINNVWRYINLGIDQLAGFLRQRGFDIRISYSLRRFSAERIFSTLDLSCQVFAFSVMSANYERCKEVVDLLRKANPKAVIVMGGGYVSRYYNEVLDEFPALDYITLGDGELPSEYLFGELRTAWIEGRSPLVNHPSVVTHEDRLNKVVQINQDVVDMPALDAYERFFPEHNRRKVHCLQSKNNICTGKCTFCTERHGHPTFRDVNVLANQIKVVHEKYGVTKFFFTDDNILDPNNATARVHVNRLCTALQGIGHKLAYQCYIKALSIHDTPEDHALLENMRRAGFIEVFIGSEAGNQEDLDLYKKLTTVEENYTAVRMVQQHDLFPILGYIAFNPYSTLDRITKNFCYLTDVGCTHLFNYIFAFVQLNKYTELYDKVKADGLLDSPGSVYVDAKYHYKNPEVNELLEYVRSDMVPKFDKIIYHLDWVIYNTKEYCWCYEDLPDFSEELHQYQREDVEFLKKYLSILFVDYNVAGFRKVADEFWGHFYSREVRLKEIHDVIIELTERGRLKC